MTTARSIIEQASRKIHVLGRGQTLSAEEANDALKALNTLLSSFSAEAGTIFNKSRETFPLTGVQSYTIGPGGNFNTTPPIIILSAYISSGALDYPPLEQKTVGEYDTIALKNVGGSPEIFYYDNSLPLGRIWLYPVAASGYTLTITSLKALTSFADLTTDYTLPDGVEMMLVFNLGVILCPDYEKEPSPYLLSEAKRTKTVVEVACRRNNYPTSTVDFGDGFANGNIFSGWLTR
jgi:hypothetical protein